MANDTRLTFLMVLTLALSGCAEMQDQLRGTMATPPRDLDAPPATTGLLIVGATLKHQGSMSFGMQETPDLVSATLVKVGDEQHPIYAGASKEMAIFQGLDPATYRLVSLRGFTGQANFTFTLDPAVVPPVVIGAGNAAYLGHLTVKGISRMGQAGLSNEYQWDRDPSRQVAALRNVLAEYPTSPWAPLLEKQIESINQNAP